VSGVPREEALSVVAHELAHARYDDVLHGSLLGAAGAVAGVGLLGLVLARRRKDVPTAGEPEVVPLVLALVAVAGLLVSPVQSGISRKVETRADVTALAATNDPEAFIELQKQLATRSLADLTSPAWSHFWFGTHPTTRERIAIAEWVSDRTLSRALGVSSCSRGSARSSCRSR
jgi:STE24 endopeptidase